ncbi:serine/arginine repetitive matrix protein 1 [Drosophila innubila]|uniref:serine/arginine repetitive matrix protein 1 n=1 Tax=Drosophila innubila TaxID=198719 RepID=UPI00148DE4FA|nr:serine/arginine repetitive matrix protein 1 [Drosophila innubila]
MSHHLPQDSQHGERGSHSNRGIMDLRNLCQRLDVDSLKAKLPSLSQLKLPKSLPKLRGARRIFRSSRENVNANSGSGQGSAAATGGGVGGVATGGLAVPQAQFINRTPQRISTISSLMHEEAVGHQGQQDHQVSLSSHHHLQPIGATYCSAGSLDDDYYAPYGSNTAARVSRPISPVKMPPPSDAAGEAPQRVSLTQRLQRGYKSLSELRLKHLFAKQTTIRRDGIEVQHYVEQYERDRRVEQLAQARRDRQIADNYDIHIRTLPITRQNTLRLEGKEKEGIVEQVQRRHAELSGDESGLETPPAPAAALRRKKPGIAATRFGKVRQPPLQMPVEQQLEEHTEKSAMRQAMRQNLKRLRKSIKRVHQQQQQPRQTTDDTDNDDDGDEEIKMRSRSSTASTLRARLRRFTSSEQLQQRWRKSFKASEPQPSDIEARRRSQAGETGGAASGGVAAQLERTMTKLNEKMHQLKFFQHFGGRTPRASQELGNKPNTVGREPIEIDDEELAGTYHHSDSSSDDSGHEDAFGQEEEEHQQQQQPPEEQSPMLVKHQTMATLAQLQAHSSTAWSSESLEEDGSVDQQLASTASDYPRVLIHQQHTDAYESTLIIAVTTTPPSPSTPSVPSVPSTPPAPPQARSTLHQWVPNEQIIAGFKEQQLPTGIWPAPALYKPKSVDIFESDGGAAFADFDEALRNAPVLRISAGSSLDSNEDAYDSSSRLTRIRVQTARIGNSCESLMEQQPLEDDDVEEEEEEEEDEEEEEEEEPDGDDEGEQEEAKQEKEKQKKKEDLVSERPPSVSPPPPPLPQRRPPPPAIMAPIYDAVPPPLPISKPPTIAAPVSTSPSPVPTPTASVARLPQRSISMTRPGKPLVKTSSLRLTYKEQMHPGDVGKVNKLISRFEGRPRLCARRLHSEELTICSDEESEELPPTPTPANVKRNNNIPDIVTTQPVNNSNSNNNNNNNNNNNSTLCEDSIQQQIQLNLDRQNSNCSRSEYGSPLSYPQRRSSTPTMLITTSGSSKALAPQSPQQSQSQSQPQSQLLQQRAQARRSRRSMTRDDDNFYSFDSDEENSYYSISPSSSSRYVVEI